MKRRAYLVFPALLLLGALVLRLVEPEIVSRAQLLVFDSYQTIKPRAYVDAGIRIVDIDDASLERLGQWPWPRSQVAQLTNRLVQLGAAAIVFDVVFAEPDRTSPSRILPFWGSKPEAELLRSWLERIPDPDAILAQSFEQAGNVVTGFVLSHDAIGGRPARQSTFASAGDDPRRFLIARNGAITNLPDLEGAAVGNGNLNMSAEFDGIVRRLDLVLPLADELYPSLVGEALRVVQGASTYIVKSSGSSGELSFGAETGIISIKVGQVVIPTDAHGRLPVYYSGAHGERQVSAWRIFEADFDPGPIRDHIVLIGSSAAGLMDLRATPLSPVVPGVEVHAEALEQIITEQFLYRPDWAPGAELVYLLVLGISLIVLIPKVGAIGCAIFGAVAMATACGFSWYIFDQHLWLVDPVYPSLVCILIYISGSLIRFLQVEADRRQVRDAFSHYMSPAMVARLAANPDRLKLGGEMRELTLMFTDIRGFTTISERFDPEGLTSFINEFMTPMTEIILDHHGTIDKYIGDCIMAFWNAPLDDAEHVSNACRSALTMLSRLEALNREWRSAALERGEEPLQVMIGIGINTGACCVGNMGSVQRFDYSVLGDEVNLAARLEGQSKSYGVDVVIGENTTSSAKDFALLELDLIKVKGKTKPARIFGLFGDEAMRQDTAFQSLAESHHWMLDAYRSQNWDDAVSALTRCRALASEVLTNGNSETLYELYHQRIVAFQERPPPVDWDGVYVALSK